MNNKKQINKLRDMAELASASYGYFNLIGKKFKDDNKYKDRKNTIISIYDILDINYKGYVTSTHIPVINTEKLKGDFTPTQARNFAERYEVIFHQPNTLHGFSATLFYDNSGI